jgi:hypothetical protein
MVQQTRNPVLDEPMVGLSELARQIRSFRREGNVTPQTCWRWIRKGVRLANGEIVRLEHVQLAGRFLTSWPAYLRFIERQTPDVARGLPAPVRSPDRRQRGSEQAERMLASAGI